jgi:zinc transport system permease protein
MIDFFKNPILQKALIAGILASLASGIMGSYVVIKKISSISGSIAHSILGGIGLFILLQYKFNIPYLNPMFGAFIAAIISSFLIGWMHLKHAQQEDATIAAIWSTGMGLGVIFIAFVPSYGEVCTHFLFGNILDISKTNIYLLLLFNALIIILVATFFKRFLAICFNEEEASLQNIHINSSYFLLLTLISISIVLLVQIIGIILVIALLTIPPTIAKIFTKKLFFMMIIAFILCAILTTLGTSISYKLKYPPPGATTAILATIAYVLTLFFKNKILKKKF